MMTVEEATAALEVATAALARLDAEIRRASEDEDGAREAFAVLVRARDEGTSPDPAALAADLVAAREAHDATKRLLDELGRQRAPLAKRVDAAVRDLDVARREAARPKAAELEAAAREAFDRAFALLAKARVYRRDNLLPSEGMHLTFNATGSGIESIARKHGLVCEIRPVRY